MEERRLWIAAARERFYALPDSHDLPAGGVALLSVEGDEVALDEAALEPFAVSDQDAEALFAAHRQDIAIGWLVSMRELLLGPESRDDPPGIDTDSLDLDAVALRLADTVKNRPEVLDAVITRIEKQSRAVDRLAELLPEETSGGKPQEHLRAVVSGARTVVDELKAASTGGRAIDMQAWVPLLGAIARFADEEVTEAFPATPPVEERVRADLEAREAAREPVSWDFQELIGKR